MNRFVCAGLAFSVGDEDEPDARAMVEESAVGPVATGGWRSPWSWFRRAFIALWLVVCVFAIGYELTAPAPVPVTATVTEIADDGWCDFTWQDPVDGATRSGSDSCGVDAAVGDPVGAWAQAGEDYAELHPWPWWGDSILDAVAAAGYLAGFATLMAVPFNYLANLYDRRRMQQAAGLRPGLRRAITPATWCLVIAAAGVGWLYLFEVSDAFWVGAPILIGIVGGPYLLFMRGRDGMPPETFASGAMEFGPRVVLEMWN